jgi:hypothetical protein
VTHFGPYYADGTPLKIGDRVSLVYRDEEFEVRSFRPEGVAVIANVTPGFKAIGTSTVPIKGLTFVARGEGMSAVKGNALTGVRCDIQPGSGNYHLRLAGCDDCNVRDFAQKSLEDIDYLYHRGYVGQAMYEAYTYVWATSATRYGSYDAWAVPPTDPEVVALIGLFQRALDDRRAVRA